MLTVDLNHVLYELSLGKCNLSLRTWSLLSIDTNLNIITDKTSLSYIKNLGHFFHHYYTYHLTPDGLLYHGKTYHARLAVEANNLDILKLMLKNGVNNINDCLEVAAANGHEHIFEYLLQHGATGYDQAMRNAVSHGQLEIVKLLSTKEINNLNEHMLVAACYGYIEMIKLFVNHGADDFNRAMLRGFNHKKIVILMIEYGANNFNEFMAYALIFKVKKSILDLIVKHGANNFNNCMLFATKKCNIRMVNLMLEYGATNVEECVNKAEELGFTDIVDILQMHNNLKT